MRWRCSIAVLAALACAAPAGAATGPPLRAGAGQADITPPQTGYFLGGWTRADRLALGVSTRLYANSLVLQRGERRLALVAVELFAVPAGFKADVAKAAGFADGDVLMAASHTHSGPGGYANNPTYNTAAPSTETITDPTSFVEFFNPAPADRQLYTFLVDRVAESIRRADADRARAVAGWGSARLDDLTQNRSLEAHLADHGLEVAVGEGKPEMDPEGAGHTIDPAVDVLRVDKLRRGRRVPIGAWSNFANHGTVVHSETQAYSGDHHAAAWRRFAARVRRAGRVPRGQTVVNVYPNSNEGDQSAGIANVGPAAAARVGGIEAGAMFTAWRRARRSLRRRPVIDRRWTRACFCGRDTATGPVDDEGVPGIGFLTGSEEGRGPLYDVTGTSFEGRTSPSEDPAQGHKFQVPAGDFPTAVPVSVTRIAGRAIAGLPGEPTKEIGFRVKTAVREALGVRRVVIAGLADEFIQYITTPEEYSRQHYEGASTLWGPNTGTFLVERAAELAAALKAGESGPEPADVDIAYGVTPDGAPYEPGSETADVVTQPEASYQRLQHATLSWRGAPLGRDRPLDTAFITAQRRVGGRWKRVSDDRGLQFLWRVDGEGFYDATWEIPVSAPRGTYRFRVTGTRYAFTSDPFVVRPARSLTAEAVDGGVRLAYPAATVDDLNARPVAASRGRVAFDGAGRVRIRRGVAAVPAGATGVAVGAARDRWGNRNGAALGLAP